MAASISFRNRSLFSSSVGFTGNTPVGSRYRWGWSSCRSRRSASPARRAYCSGPPCFSQTASPCTECCFSCPRPLTGHFLILRHDLRQMETDGALAVVFPAAGDADGPVLRACKFNIGSQPPVYILQDRRHVVAFFQIDLFHIGICFLLHPLPNSFSCAWPNHQSACSFPNFRWIFFLQAANSTGRPRILWASLAIKSACPSCSALIQKRFASEPSRLKCCPRSAAPARLPAGATQGVRRRCTGTGTAPRGR